MRPGKEEPILCAEISEHTHRPGIDIFHFLRKRRNYPDFFSGGRSSV